MDIDRRDAKTDRDVALRQLGEAEQILQELRNDIESLCPEEQLDAEHLQVACLRVEHLLGASINVLRPHIRPCLYDAKPGSTGFTNEAGR